MARKKRKAPGVNASSSADIAFMLLIFFLITTSMDTDKGLPRRLPPPVPKDQKQNDAVDINQLKDKAKEFIENPNNEEHKPEKIEVDVPYFGKQMVTKNHIISLQNDRGTTYSAYIQVQNELAAAYGELRDAISEKKFGKKFADLDEDKQAAVQMIYPQKISEAEPKNYAKVK